MRNPLLRAPRSNKDFSYITVDRIKSGVWGEYFKLSKMYDHFSVHWLWICLNVWVCFSNMKMGLAKILAKYTVSVLVKWLFYLEGRAFRQLQNLVMNVKYLAFYNVVCLYYFNCCHSCCSCNAFIAAFMSVHSKTFFWPSCARSRFHTLHCALKKSWRRIIFKID